MSAPLVEAEHLMKRFPLSRSLAAALAREPEEFVQAVDDVSLEIQPGETLGLIGESGSGKTTLGWLFAKLHSPTGGRIRFEGQDITNLSGRDLLEWRRNVQVVFQDPVGSLDPLPACLANRRRTRFGPGAGLARGAEGSCRGDPPVGGPPSGDPRPISS